MGKNWNFAKIWTILVGFIFRMTFWEEDWNDKVDRTVCVWWAYHYPYPSVILETRKSLQNLSSSMKVYENGPHVKDSNTFRRINVRAYRTWTIVHQTISNLNPYDVACSSEKGNPITLQELRAGLHMPNGSKWKDPLGEVVKTTIKMVHKCRAPISEITQDGPFRL